MRAVSDAGPLIHLSWIDQLQLLRQFFDEVIVPPAVRREVLILPPPGTLGLTALEQAFERGDIRVSTPIGQASTYLGALDRGEAEAVTLAERLDADVFLTDDSHARRVAGERGLAVVGTLGILRIARQRGLITATYPLVMELQRLGQWLSQGLLESVRDEDAQHS